MKRLTAALSVSLALFLFMLSAPSTPAQSFDVKTHTLKNGMKILVLQQVAKKYAGKMDVKQINQADF